MKATRNNPATSLISGKGKGWGVAVPNPGLSDTGTLGDAVAASTTAGIEVGNYNFITLILSDALAGGTVAPEGSPGWEPGSSNKVISPFAPITNSMVGVGAVTLANLVYTYADDTTITIPVHGLKLVRFVLTGGAVDIRYTLHA